MEGCVCKSAVYDEFKFRINFVVLHSVFVPSLCVYTCNPLYFYKDITSELLYFHCMGVGENYWTLVHYRFSHIVCMNGLIQSALCKLITDLECM